jgi:thioesterase domain-containing protein
VKLFRPNFLSWTSAPQNAVLRELTNEESASRIIRLSRKVIDALLRRNRPTASGRDATVSEVACRQSRNFFWLDGPIYAADSYPDLRVVYVSLWPLFSIRPNLDYLAEEFAQKIRAVQPTGPYYFGGLCLSSLVAYEVGRKLVASGCEVGTLLLLEPWRPGLDAMSRRIIQRLLLSIFCPATLVHFCSFQLERLRRLSRRSPDARPESLTDAQRSELAWAKMRSQASAKVFENYVIHPYQGRLTVVVGARSPQRFLVRQAWAAFARGGIDIHVLSGVHNDIFLQNPAFIAKIRECVFRNPEDRSRGGDQGRGSLPVAGPSATDALSVGNPAGGGHGPVEASTTLDYRWPPGPRVR